jgi:hypothetical protein
MCVCVRACVQLTRQLLSNMCVCVSLGGSLATNNSGWEGWGLPVM